MEPELQFFYNKIKDKENFALVRFGDGEHNILDNVECHRNGFDYDPGDSRDQEFREQLREAYLFKSPQYYKGVGSSDKLPDESQLASACVFVNTNYLDFLDKFSELFENCIFIGNELGMQNQLPFVGERYVRIKDNAWKDFNSNMLPAYLSKHLEDNRIEDKIILVAGGVFANVLIHKLYQKHPNNTYINIGSVYDPFLYGVLTRQYQERLCDVS